MDMYLAPRAIAEDLGLTRIRKSTPDGMYLLSEYDIMAYGKQRALDDGAIVLSSPTRQTNSADASAESDNNADSEVAAETEAENAEEVTADDDDTEANNNEEEETV